MKEKKNQTEEAIIKNRSLWNVIKVKKKKRITNLKRGYA